MTPSVKSEVPVLIRKRNDEGGPSLRGSVKPQTGRVECIRNAETPEVGLGMRRNPFIVLSLDKIGNICE